MNWGPVCRCDVQRRGKNVQKEANVSERQDQGRQDRDKGTEPQRQARERRVPAPRVSVNYAEKISYFRVICAEITDSVKPILLARSSSLCAFLFYARASPLLGYGEKPVCFKRRVFDSVLNVFQTVSITQRPNLGV